LKGRKDIVKLSDLCLDLPFEKVQHLSRRACLIRGYRLLRLCSREKLPNRIRFVSRLAFVHDGVPRFGQA
jgi:hypothetical protein